MIMVVVGNIRRDELAELIDGIPEEELDKLLAKIRCPEGMRADDFMDIFIEDLKKYRKRKGME